MNAKLDEFTQSMIKEAVSLDADPFETFEEFKGRILRNGSAIAMQMRMVLPEFAGLLMACNHSGLYGLRVPSFMTIHAEQGKFFHRVLPLVAEKFRPSAMAFSGIALPVGTSSNKAAKARADKAISSGRFEGFTIFVIMTDGSEVCTTWPDSQTNRQSSPPPGLRLRIPRRSR